MAEDSYIFPLSWSLQRSCIVHQASNYPFEKLMLLEKQMHAKLFRVLYLHEKNEPYKILLAAFYKVGRVTAIDEDHPPNCLTYRITSGDIEAVQRFWIHPRSGMIELTTQPDYESVKQYNLTVEAVDCDRVRPRTAVTTVSRDNQPTRKFMYQGPIYYSRKGQMITEHGDVQSFLCFSSIPC